MLCKFVDFCEPERGTTQRLSWPDTELGYGWLRFLSSIL